MNASIPTSAPTVIPQFDGDRWGIVASVFCAIHCAVTPLLFIFAPTFGGIWAHPASHWIVALFVVPLALAMVVRGFRVHRKKWIIACALLGIALVIAGAIVPYWSNASKENLSDLSPATTPESPETTPTTGDGSNAVVGTDLQEESCPMAEEAACLDACCPSLVADSAGNTTLHIPTASIVTTLGGILLIGTHLGNLCACRKQRKTDCCDSPFC